MILYSENQNDAQQERTSATIMMRSVDPTHQYGDEHCIVNLESSFDSLQIAGFLYSSSNKKQDMIYDAAELISDCSSTTTSGDESSQSDIPEAEATLVHPSIFDHYASQSSSSSLYAMMEDFSMQPFSGSATDMRPEFLYASASIPCTFSPMTTWTSSISTTAATTGIHLRPRSTFGVAIATLEDDSPFGGSNLAAGDHIVAINGVACADASLCRVEKLMVKAAAAASSSSTGMTMSICVHNEQGDPDLVSSSIQKPNPRSKTGIFLRSTSGAVRFSKVKKDGLFGHSLLMPQHRCMAINRMSCEHMDARMAGDLIAAARNRVTIVSKPQPINRDECYAVTIALVLGDHKKIKWWKNTPIPEADADAAGRVAAICYLS